MTVYCGPRTEGGTVGEEKRGGKKQSLALENFKLRDKISDPFKAPSEHMQKKSNRTPGC